MTYIIFEVWQRSTRQGTARTAFNPSAWRVRNKDTKGYMATIILVEYKMGYKCLEERISAIKSGDYMDPQGGNSY